MTPRGVRRDELVDRFAVELDAGGQVVATHGWPDAEVVATAANGVDAWDAFLETEPAVCFLDIRMPGLTGVEAAKQIAQMALQPDELLPEIVFITAYDQYAVEAFEQGVADYVLKPAERERLAVTVERIRRRLASRGTREFLELALELHRLVEVVPIFVGPRRDERLAVEREPAVMFDDRGPAFEDEDLAILDGLLVEGKMDGRQSLAGVGQQHHRLAVLDELLLRHGQVADGHLHVDAQADLAEHGLGSRALARPVDGSKRQPDRLAAEAEIGSNRQVRRERKLLVAHRDPESVGRLGVRERTHLAVAGQELRAPA